MAVGSVAETTTKGRGRSDFAGQRRRSLDLLPEAHVADGTPLKRQFRHHYDSGHRVITEWAATDTTAMAAFTLGTDFNVAQHGDRDLRNEPRGHPQFRFRRKQHPCYRTNPLLCLEPSELPHCGLCSSMTSANAV
jgi:hypothetical protein